MWLTKEDKEKSLKALNKEIKRIYGTEIDASRVQILQTGGISLNEDTIQRLLDKGYKIKYENGKKIIYKESVQDSINS